MANNWDKLQCSIGDEAFDTIRHDCGRKLDSFRDARETVKISRGVYEQLDKVELANDPFGDLPEQCEGSIFIAKVGKKEYLVNTEGFSYCRYIAKVKVI